MRRSLMMSLAGLGAGIGAVPVMGESALAQPVAQVNDAELLARLTPEQAGRYGEWRQARAAYDGVYDRYWTAIAAMKTERRRKRGAGIAISPADFMAQHPPKYTGPVLRADIAKIMAEMKPVQPETPIPLVADAVAQARQNFGFVPLSTSEREFKRSYAIEALSFGLSRDQVVRVYALETGGRGTFDMQAGFNPETRQGRAISTALGYAQLLAANSIDELVRHGDGFCARLDMLAVAPGTTHERAAELAAKAGAVKAMLKVARGVPQEWSRHVRLAATEAGIGIHALNLDADIGPWLQSVKLKGLKDLAERSGRPALTGAEIELMNLAGPRTGLDMLEPVAHAASTGNFFSAGGYYRNSIVRDKTAAELLVALDGRMNDNLRHAGAIEFAEVFDEVLASGVTPRPFNYEQAAAAMGLQRAPVPVRTSAPAHDATPRMQWAPRQFSDRPQTGPLKWSPMTVTD